MTTIPAPVGWLARAAWAMKRVPSDEVSRRSREPAEPPAIGRMGGRESLSTHMGPPSCAVAAWAGGPLPRRPSACIIRESRRRIVQNTVPQAGETPPATPVTFPITVDGAPKQVTWNPPSLPLTEIGGLLKFRIE